MSPVFGGYTAQAEFEVLWACPRYKGWERSNSTSSTELGRHCMPDIFRELGYRTIASNGYKPNFSTPQWPIAAPASRRSISRTNTRPTVAAIFPPRCQQGEIHVRPTLFEQNLASVGRHIREGDGRPLFNYVLTIYGHFPYRLDTEKAAMGDPCAKYQTGGQGADGHRQSGLLTAAARRLPGICRRCTGLTRMLSCPS